MWLKAVNGTWLNAQYIYQYAFGVSGVDATKWAVFANMAIPSIAAIELAGLYANQAAATAGAAKLAQGFDPSVLV